MIDLDRDVLGLLTEDSYALAEVCSYIASELGVDPETAQQATIDSLGRLLELGFIEVVRRPADGSSTSQEVVASADEFASSADWAKNSWTVLAFASKSGTDEYHPSHPS